MISPSKLRPFDIFFAERNEDKHYYVCVYSQELDGNNTLKNDVYGLIITSNQKYRYMEKNDYNVEISINGKPSWVCCDKMVRLRINEDVTEKNIKLTRENIIQIKDKMAKFFIEIQRQTLLEELE